MCRYVVGNILVVYLVGRKRSPGFKENGRQPDVIGYSYTGVKGETAGGFRLIFQAGYAGAIHLKSRFSPYKRTPKRYIKPEGVFKSAYYIVSSLQRKSLKFYRSFGGSLYRVA